MRERCVSGRDSTRWIERHASEAGKSLTRKDWTDRDHGPPPVTILQALVMRRSRVQIPKAAHPLRRRSPGK
jgi:hypothetical protein